MGDERLKMSKSILHKTRLSNNVWNSVSKGK